MKQKRVYNDVRLDVIHLSGKTTLLSGSGESSGAPTYTFGASLNAMGTASSIE